METNKLYIITVQGDDYTALKFENNIGKLQAVYDYYNGNESNSEKEEEESNIDYDVSEYTFSTVADMEKAMEIFSTVHGFIDYDHRKSNNVYLVTKEEYSYFLNKNHKK